ncbi:MAG: phosphate ABC transporter permease subunit PstC [Microthrixaceae bacterium]
MNEPPTTQRSGVLRREDLVGDRRSARGDTAFEWGTQAAGWLVLVVLGAIALSMTAGAMPAIRKAGIGYLFGRTWQPNNELFGSSSIVYGTVVTSLIALVVAVPVSIGIALFITELVPRRFRQVIISVIDVLASVPSVVFGLWGLMVLRPHLSDVYNSIADTFAGVPVLRSLFGPSTGFGFMTAGLVVGLMIVPIVTSIIREVFSTVPTVEKHGALALGATRWEMIRGVVFPHSTGGVVGAVMLGLGRAMGETIAVALLIGASAQVSANLFAPGEAMPSVIARNLNEADGTFRAALIGLGLGLMVLTVIINVGARLLVRRVELRTKGTR